MNHYPSNVKQKLETILSEMSEKYWIFTNNPGHDFMRQSCGKLSFFDTIRLIIAMGKGSTNDELIEYFEMDPDRLPSQSAFTQRRSQISLSAFEYLFSEFSASFPTITHGFKDYCVLAFDGTHVVYSTNAEILEDYNHHFNERRGYNHMHLNGFVDVASKAFLDIYIQPGQKHDEREALHEMLAHFKPDNPEKYIITVDRGYESYDFLFDCELKHLKYVARVKAPSVATSILSAFKNELPDELDEFDIQVKRFFTNKKNHIIKQQKDVYIYMNPNKNVPHFYQLLENRHAFYMTFRILKIKTGPNSYEYIITNLPDSMSLDDIRECYHMRWGIEVSFRYLKHAAGLLHFHSRKPEYLKQEIFATLIMYNFGIFIANEAVKINAEKKRDAKNKYRYEIDLSTAIKTARKYLLRSTPQKPIDIIKLLLRYVHAVKDSYRMFPRPLRSIGAIHFSYR